MAITHPLMAKLLSHRLRGYAAREHSRAGIQRVGELGVPFIEIDVRAARDGVLFAVHDASFEAADGRTVRLADSAGADVLKEMWKGEPILTLEAALEAFLLRSGSGQRLCLDIKDLGFEDAIVEVVRRHGLSGRAIYVSWIPQALERLARLDPQTPLILSQWNLTAFGVVGRVVDRIIRYRRVSRGKHVLMGANPTEEDGDTARHGFRHTLVSHGVPANLREILRASRGGICVHRTLAGPRLGHYCRSHGLQLWVYGTRATADFKAVARHEWVDVVFSDDALAVARDLLAETTG